MLSVLLTKANFADFKYRYIVEGGKLVLLDEETGPKYFNKVVKMRSPQYCKNPNGKICSKCLGELYYKLNIKNVGLTGSRASSTLLNLSMKKFHDPSIKIYSVTPDTMLLSTNAKASQTVKESVEWDLLDFISEASVNNTEKPVPSGRGFFHASNIQNLRMIEPKVTGSYKDMGHLVFGSQSKAFATCFGGAWNDSDADIGVVHSTDNDTPTIDDIKHIVFNYDPDVVDVNKPASLYQVSGKFTYLDYEGNLEIISDSKCRVVKEEKYNTWKEMMEAHGVIVKPY